MTHSENEASGSDITIDAPVFRASNLSDYTAFHPGYVELELKNH